MTRDPAAGAVDGLLVVDKCPGPTSHDVVDLARRALGERRIGHTGTLDPMAGGVLILMLGAATRLAPVLGGHDKSYEGEALLGQATDTYDSSGRPEGPAGDPGAVDDDALRAAAARLTGVLSQLPPPYSARKVDGVPLYRHARRGRAVERKATQVSVHLFEVTPTGGGAFRFRARVSAGTYIRSLVHDLGQALGCGAHMTALRRTGAGPFDLAQALPQSGLAGPGSRDLRDRMAAAEPPPWFVPLDRIPLELPQVVLADSQAVADLQHGRPARVTGGLPPGPLLQARDADGRLLALVQPDPGDAGRVLPRRVLPLRAATGL